MQCPSCSAKEFENKWIKAIPDKKCNRADKKLGKWDFYPTTNLSIHCTGDFTVKVFQLEGPNITKVTFNGTFNNKGQIQMTNNKNI